MKSSYLAGALLQLMAARASSTLPKLKYFDAKGAGELSRVLLSLGGVEFEERRYPVASKVGGGFEAVEFGQDKAQGLFKVNMGRLPILELPCGRQIGQSRAIERYVCYRANLMGDDPEEAALIDAFTENIRDIKDRWAQIHFAPVSPERDEKTEKFFAKELPSWLKKLQASLPEPQASAQHVVGRRTSYADVTLWHLLRDYFPQRLAARVQAAETSAGSARLSAIADSIAQQPGLQAYLQSRPKTIF